ncbi:hypothetical protein Nepgr_033871 [Nepenthes gracilis]|uniref:Uncharacterized protein n=1 Tax=Nepenthes gracilis TaxID=150966 RepID=A0AAD3TN42_NEPGR|nr:hypothetical protein Nepgr_033871 [Nepenthes gracilis]
MWLFFEMECIDGGVKAIVKVLSSVYYTSLEKMVSFGVLEVVFDVYSLLLSPLPISCTGGKSGNLKSVSKSGLLVSLLLGFKANHALKVKGRYKRLVG